MRYQKPALNSEVTYFLSVEKGWKHANCIKSPLYIRQRTDSTLTIFYHVTELISVR